MKKDKQATMAARFLDKRSYITPDGREVLTGYKNEDWARRKVELLERSKGQCERFTILGKAHDAFCRGEGGEPHHIKPRYPRRDDRLSNLANLSHWCHAAEDKRKIRGDKLDRRTSDVGD